MSRWVILAVGTLSQAATSSFTYGIPMLVPALRSQEGLSLVQATTVVAAPTIGLLLTLVAWGALADRFGEKVVIGSGVALAAAFLAGTWLAHGVVGLALLLGAAGAGGASVNAASGRVVMGWFPVHQRGVAMGTRQTAQPLGVAIAGLALPPLAHAYGLHAALLFPAVFCALLAVAVVVLLADPPRAPRLAGTPVVNPYRQTSALWRVHAASTLLVVPQFAVSTFTLVYLVGERGWSAPAAGRLVFAFQFLGAVGRVGSGVWSDRVGSRLAPMRQLAAAAALLMGLLALGAAAHGVWIVAVLGAASVITVADNGLAYTSVAEIAGSSWSGRALGIHNTAQNVIASATAPALGAAIGGWGYAVAFGCVVLPPLVAVPLTPVSAERQGTWRRMRDLNPRGVAPNTISNRAP